MSWVITLKVTDCASASTLVAGATVTSGTLLLGSTDANGQYILAVDGYDWVILTFAKGAIEPCRDNARNPAGHPGFISKNVTVTSGQNGQILDVCLNQAPWPSCEPYTGPSCFIVSATTGSADSAEVRALRALRDRASAKSGIAEQLIATFYEEYERFSPALAANLQVDATVREVVLQLVVRPLIAWFNLAGALGFGEADDQVRERKQQLADACLKPLADTVLTQLTAVREGAALPADAPPMLRELLPRVAHLRFASWGLLDPLIRTWTSARDGLDPVEQIGQWLATAPVEALPSVVAMDEAKLERELAALAAFFDFSPNMKAQLGERLSNVWPEATRAVQRAGLSELTA